MSLLSGGKFVPRQPAVAAAAAAVQAARAAATAADLAQAAGLASRDATALSSGPISHAARSEVRVAHCDPFARPVYTFMRGAHRAAPQR